MIYSIPPTFVNDHEFGNPDNIFLPIFFIFRQEFNCEVVKFTLWLVPHFLNYIGKLIIGRQAFFGMYFAQFSTKRSFNSETFELIAQISLRPGRFFWVAIFSKKIS